MLITLYRVRQVGGQDVVEESKPLRKIAVPRMFHIMDVRTGIRAAVANYGGFLAMKFQATVVQTPVVVHMKFHTDEKGFNLREFAEVWATQIVDKLKLKSVELLEAKS